MTKQVNQPKQETPQAGPDPSSKVSSKHPFPPEVLGPMVVEGLKRVQELAKQGKLPKVY